MSTKKVAAVIPARFASTRLPGKPLLSRTGKSLIRHVYENTQRCKAIDLVCVATDHRAIYKEVKSFGGNVMMTSKRCRTGTNRVAEVVRRIPHEIILNVQGDEPEVPPALFRRLIKELQKGTDYVTAANRFRSMDEIQDPNHVKVVVNKSNEALYFSRSPIPYVRSEKRLLHHFPGFHHIGIYGYRRQFLLKLSRMKPGKLAVAESLEQLTPLAQGFPLKVCIGRWTTPAGIDTIDDYKKFVNRHKGKHGHG